MFARLSVLHPTLIQIHFSEALVGLLDQRQDKILHICQSEGPKSKAEEPAWMAQALLRPALTKVRGSQAAAPPQPLSISSKVVSSYTSFCVSINLLIFVRVLQ